MCGLKKLASGVFPESWKVLAKWQQRRWRRRWRKQTKTNKFPGYPGSLNNVIPTSVTMPPLFMPRHIWFHFLFFISHLCTPVMCQIILTNCWWNISKDYILRWRWYSWFDNIHRYEWCHIKYSLSVCMQIKQFMTIKLYKIHLFQASRVTCPYTWPISLALYQVFFITGCKILNVSQYICNVFYCLIHDKMFCHILLHTQ